MKQHIKKIVLYALILLVCIVLFQLYLRDYVTLETIKKHRQFLQSVVSYNYTLAVFFYMVTYLTAIIFMLPLISLLSVLGGFLFGPFWSMVFINGVATVGTLIVVVFLRYLLKRNKVIAYKGSLEHFNAMVLRHGIIYLLLVRLIFIIPFFVVNSLLALTSISLKTIAWTTSLGTIPITFFFVSAGSQLEQINNLSDLISLKVVLFFVFLVAILLIPAVLKKIKII